MAKPKLALWLESILASFHFPTASRLLSFKEIPKSSKKENSRLKTIKRINFPLLEIVLVFLTILVLGVFPKSAVAAITIVSGNGQTGQINAPLPDSLVVEIDCSGNPLVIPPPCGSVTWTSSESSDSFAPNPSSTTGSVNSATSSTTLILGPVPGIRTITASSIEGSVTFTATGIGTVSFDLDQG